MADIELLPLHSDSRSMISYPPLVITRPSPSPSAMPIVPISALFPMTSLSICDIRPYPEPYPPAAHRLSHIIIRCFELGHPHSHIPHDVWHVVTCPTPLLHSGMHVTIEEYGVGVTRVFIIRVGGISMLGLEDRETFGMHCCWSELGEAVNLGLGVGIFLCCCGEISFISFLLSFLHDLPSFFNPFEGLF